MLKEYAFESNIEWIYIWVKYLMNTYLSQISKEYTFGMDIKCLLITKMHLLWPVPTSGTRSNIIIKIPPKTHNCENRRSSSRNRGRVRGIYSDPFFCERLFQFRRARNKLPEFSERETAWFRVRPYKSLSRLFSQFTISSGFAHIPDRKQRTYKTRPRRSKKYLSTLCT